MRPVRFSDKMASASLKRQRMGPTCNRNGSLHSLSGQNEVCNCQSLVVVLRACILRHAEQPRQRGALFIGGHYRVLVDGESCPTYELRQGVSVGHLNCFVEPRGFRYSVNSLIDKVLCSLVESLHPKGNLLTLHRKGCQLEPDKGQVCGTDQGRSEQRVYRLERIGIF